MNDKENNLQKRYNIGTRREEVWIQTNEFGAVLMSFIDDNLAARVFEDLNQKDIKFYDKNLFGRGFHTENGVNFYTLGYN